MRSICLRTRCSPRLFCAGVSCCQPGKKRCMLSSALTCAGSKRSAASYALR
jgi:hypothetical protein